MTTKCTKCDATATHHSKEGDEVIPYCGTHASTAKQSGSFISLGVTDPPQSRTRSRPAL